MLGNILFLCALGSTWFMTGVIWFVQVVHYPLFAKVGESAFSTYESLHTMRTGWVVAPMMILELGSTCLLLVEKPSLLMNPGHSLSSHSLHQGVELLSPHSSLLIWLLVACTLGVWASTFFIQVPLHGQLLGGGDQQVIHRLVASNWIRTVLWTVKSLLLLWIVWNILQN